MNIGDETLDKAVRAYLECNRNNDAAARLLNVPRTTIQHWLKKAALYGKLPFDKVAPGFGVVQASSKLSDGTWVKQRQEPGPKFEIPEGQTLDHVSALCDSEDRILYQWKITERDKLHSLEKIQLVADELKKELYRVPASPAVHFTNHELLTQYTLTDLHFGMLSWAEETKNDDYNIKEAERLLLAWVRAAIQASPNSEVGVIAQLGDLLHYDGHKSETPQHRNVLDSDTRFQKIIRVVVRTFRQIVAMLLEKHNRVHVIMASANHDPASSAWLREMFSVVFEEEPRITVDTSPSEYYAYEWGNTALFYHHGHRRKVNDVDRVFAAMFREMYGRCEYSYGHVGHKHSDEIRDGGLIKIEQHRTLAPPDAYASSLGYAGKRDAKIICYHKRFGEVSRSIISPKMVSP